MHISYDLTDLGTKVNSNDIYGGIQHSLIYTELIVLLDNVVNVPTENHFIPTIV
jgi:hypothetical protein